MIVDQLIENVIKKQKEKKKSLIQFKQLLAHENLEQRVKAIKEIEHLINSSNFKQAFIQDRIHVYIFEQCLKENVDGEFFKIATAMLRSLFEESPQAAVEIIDKMLVMLHKPKYNANMHFYITIRHIISSVAATQTLIGSQFLPIYIKFYISFVQNHAFNFQMTNSFSYQQYLSSIENITNTFTDNSQTSNLSLDEDRAYSIAQHVTKQSINVQEAKSEGSVNNLLNNQTGTRLKKNTLSTQSLLSNFGVTLFEDDTEPKKGNFESIAEAAEISINHVSQEYSLNTTDIFDDSVFSSTSFLSNSEPHEIDNLDSSPEDFKSSHKYEVVSQKIINILEHSDTSSSDNNETTNTGPQQFEKLAISGPMAHPYVEPTPRPHFVPPLNLSFLSKAGIRDVVNDEVEELQPEQSQHITINTQKINDTDHAFKDQIDQVHDAKKGQILMAEIGKLIGQFTALSDYTTITMFLVKKQQYNIQQSESQNNLKKQYLDILTKNTAREYDYFHIDFFMLDNYIDIINEQKPDDITRIGYFYLLHQIGINTGTDCIQYSKDLIPSMTLDLAYLRSRKQGMLPACIIAITSFYRSLCLVEIPYICDVWLQNQENMYNYADTSFKFFDEVSQKYITKEDSNMKVVEKRVIEKHINYNILDRFQGYRRSRVLLLTLLCDKISMLIQHYKNLSALEDISVCLGVLYDIMCATKCFGFIRKAVVDLCFPSLLKLLSLLIERKIRARQYYIFISHRLLQIFNNLLENNYKTNDYQQNNINQILLNLFLHQQIPVNYWLKRYAYFILMNSRVMIEVSGLYTNQEQCEESFVQIRQTFFIYIMNLSELITHYYYFYNFNLNQEAQFIQDINIEYCNFGKMSNTVEQNFPKGRDDNFDLKLNIEQLPLNMMLQNLVNKQTMNQLRNKTLFQKQRNTVKDQTNQNNIPLEGFDIDYIVDYEVGVVMQYLINNQQKVMTSKTDRKLYLTCLQALERFINIPTIINQLQKPQLNQFIIFHYLSFLKFYNSCLETYGLYNISDFQLAAAHLLVLQKFTQIDDHEIKQHIYSIRIVEFLAQQLKYEVNMPNNIELDTSSSTISFTLRSNSTITLADLEIDFFDNEMKSFVLQQSIEQPDSQIMKQEGEKIVERSTSSYDMDDSSMLSDISITQKMSQDRPPIAQLPILPDANLSGGGQLGTGRLNIQQQIIKKNMPQFLPEIGQQNKKQKINNTSFNNDAIPMINLNYNNDNSDRQAQQQQNEAFQRRASDINLQLKQNDIALDLKASQPDTLQLELQADKIFEEETEEYSESYSYYDSDDLSDISIQPQCQNKPNLAAQAGNLDLQLPPINLTLNQQENIQLMSLDTTKVPLITNQSFSDSYDQQQQPDLNVKFHLLHGLKSSKNVKYYETYQQTDGIPQIPIYYDDHLHEVLIILLMNLIIKPSTQTFDPYYVIQFPYSQGMTNILYILHQHLNHKNNQKVVNKLLDKQHPPAIKRLLRLLCYQQFNTSFYNLEKFTLIAKGAFGEVYYGNVDLIKFKELEAYSTPVALKIQPLSKDIYDRCVLHDLYNEITAMERLQEFQSFCQIYDYGVTPQGYIMVMQKYHTSFRDFRRQLFTKPEKQIHSNMLPRYGHEESMMKYIRIFLFTYIMLLEQLKVMHQNKVIHFDLKTDNIFVSPATIHWICLSELPKLDNTGNFQRLLLNKFLKIYNHHQLPYSITLGDFGESYIYSSENDKQTLLAKGTEFNKSPEMLTATNTNQNHEFIHGRQHGSGPPSDVWSAACTLYEILTGDYLFYDMDWSRFFVRVTTMEQNIEYGKDSFTFSNCPEAVQCIRGLRLTPQKKAMLGNCQPLIDLLEFQLVQVPLLRPSIHQCIEMTKHVVNVYFPHSYNYVEGTNRQQFGDGEQKSVSYRQSSRKSQRPGADVQKGRSGQNLDFVMKNCKFPEVAWDFTIHQSPDEKMQNIYDILTPHATIINNNMNIKGIKLQMIKQKQPTKPSDVLGNQSIWLGSVNDLQNFNFTIENNIQTIVDCTTSNINLKNGLVSRIFRPNPKLFQLFKNQISVLKKEEFKKLIILLDQIADVVRSTFTLNGCLLFIDETSNEIAANLSLFCIMEFQLMHLYQSTVYLKHLRPGAKLNVNFMELLLFWHEKRHKIGMKMLQLFTNTKLRINSGINMHDPEIHNFATTRVSQANYRCVCGRTFFLIKPKVETQYVICNCIISDEYGHVRDSEGIYVDCPTTSCRTIQNYYMQLFGLKLYKLVWAYLSTNGLISNCDHTTQQVATMPEFKDSIRHDFQLRTMDETRGPLYRLQNKPGWAMYYCVLCGSPTHCIKVTKYGTEIAVLATFSNK